MNTALLNSSNLDKSFIQFENNSTNELFLQLNSPESNQIDSSFFSKKSSSDSSGDSTDEDSIKSSKILLKTSLNSLNKGKKSKFYLTQKSNVRKDLYGNVIKKGGQHKVSFKDNIKGKKLVEMTLIDVKQNSLRGKNYKKYTVSLEAKDKRELSVCNIF